MTTVTPAFEETTELPTGRKARVIDPVVWTKLAESAERGVAFVRTAAKEVIDELRKDLTSAAVRNKYDVTTETAQQENGDLSLKFSATGKADN